MAAEELDPKVTANGHAAAPSAEPEDPVKKAKKVRAPIQLVLSSFLGFATSPLSPVDLTFRKQRQQKKQPRRPRPLQKLRPAKLLQVLQSPPTPKSRPLLLKLRKRR